MNELKELMDAAGRGDLAAVQAILHRHSEIINERDETGATALHCAALGGHRAVVEELVKQGAEINARDHRFGATPTGWAIEYLREMGGFLSIELSDFAYAIERGEVEWVARFLRRFPALRAANDPEGRPFRRLAEECGNPEIAKLFGSSAA